MDGIESLCSRLPGTPAKLCKDEVEKMFPLAVTYLTTVMVSVWEDVASQINEAIQAHTFFLPFSLETI